MLLTSISVFWRFWSGPIDIKIKCWYLKAKLSNIYQSKSLIVLTTSVEKEGNTERRWKLWHWKASKIKLIILSIKSTVYLYKDINWHPFYKPIWNIFIYYFFLSRTCYQSCSSGSEWRSHSDDLLIIDPHPFGQGSGLEKPFNRAMYVVDAFSDDHLFPDSLLKACQLVVPIQHWCELHEFLLEFTQLCFFIGLTFSDSHRHW